MLTHTTTGERVVLPHGVPQELIDIVEADLSTMCCTDCAVSGKDASIYKVIKEYPLIRVILSCDFCGSKGAVTFQQYWP